MTAKREADSSGRRWMPKRKSESSSHAPSHPVEVARIGSLRNARVRLELRRPASRSLRRWLALIRCGESMGFTHANVVRFGGSVFGILERVEDVGFGVGNPTDRAVAVEPL